jgi:hypothetical protein
MTESHLRRLSVSMRALEDALLEIGAALAPGPDLLMTTYENDIPEAPRPEIEQRIRRLREEIRAVKDSYGLNSQVISNRNRVSAKLAIVSVDLAEATSRHMRAYGEIPQHEQAPLDNRIGAIIAIVESISKLL